MKFRALWSTLLVVLLLHHTDACNRRRRSGPPPDKEKPKVKVCRGNIHANAEPRQRGTRVRWDPKVEIVFEDKGSGFKRKWLGSGSGSPGDYFPEQGSPHKIAYSAEDNAGNILVNGCVFFIYIRVIQCELLIAPSHGYSSCTHGNIYGSVCSINCMSGYIRVGAATITCQKNGEWEQLPTCEAVTCEPELTDITDGSVTCTQQNYYQSSCIYQCADGFSIARGQLNGRICGPNGGWSGGEPTCEDTDGPDLECPRPVVVYADEGETSTQVFWDEPTAVDNSGTTVLVVKTDGPDPGTILDAGYYTVRYVATDDSGNQAQCQFSLLVRVIRCPGIYGSHTQLVDCPTGFNYGSVCTIRCAAGYVISGETELRCERIGDPPKGKWNLERPICNAVQCPALQPPENGAFRNGVSSCPTDYASWCYFECDEGYERIGSYSRHCLSHSGELEGFWDGEETTCEPASCPSPYIPAQARIVNVVECPAIGNIPAGTTCRYACEDGHILIGQENITCDSNGRWDGSFPRCQIITCDNSAVPVPENGFKNRCPFQRIPFGSNCLLGCNQGYMPVKGAEVTCLANEDGSGRWDGPTFTVCDPVTCVPFDPPKNGYILGCTYEGATTDVTEPQTFQTVCTGACNNGYTPFGTINRNCLLNAIWDGTPLRCIDLTAPAITCPDPITAFALPRNDFVISDFPWEPLQVDDASPPVDVRLLSINSVGEGENRTTIFKEGSYSFLYAASDQEGNEDTCTVDLTVRVTRCPPLATPQYGESELITGQGRCEGYPVLGSICQVTCEEGYHLEDDSDAMLIECLALTSYSTLGYWDEQPGQCIPNTCNVPNVENGYISGCLIARVDYLSTCQFVCNVGFESPVGPPRLRRTCKADGSWTESDLICQAIKCPGSFELENGLISPDDCYNPNLLYGTVCQFACDDGFRQIGPYSKRCGEDGTWSNPRNVACVDEQAPRFTDNCPRYIQVYAESGSTEAVIDYEIPEATDNAGDDQVVIEKQSGLDPASSFSEGSHIVTYTATDEAGNLARCDIHITVLVHRCSSVQAPASGSVDCPNQVLGSQCFFQCNSGYEIDGADNATCILQASRPTWNRNPPRCSAVQCPALPNNPPAIKSGCQTPTYGAVCLWACPYGYQGNGDSASTCQADGSWSGTDFSCEERQCPDKSFPDFIREQPPNCGNNPSFEDSCHLSCKRPGFRIDPPTLDFIRCRGDGQWSQDTSDLDCIDYEAPRFIECPLDFPVYAARGATQAFVEWEVAVEDNSGEDIEIQCDREAMTYPIGDYFTSCSGRDSAGNVATCQFWFRVRTRNCQQLNPPVFGDFVGPCPTIHGSKCTVKCVSGYKLDGPDKVTCERNEETQAMYWERERHPVCRISSCAPISTDIIPLGGGIYPTFCTGNTNPNYGVSCRFYCRNGYSLIGHQDPISCTREGTWDVDLDTVQFECEDRVNPIVEVCPGNQYANLNEGVADVEVYFDTPTARDNSGQQLRVVTTPEDISSPYRFSETTVVRYEFFDANNNSASCSFQVFIQNNLFPEIDFCPSNFEVQATSRLTEVDWDPPLFSEPSGDDAALLISCNFESGTTFPWGTHNIICGATNRNNGKTVECRFTIEVIPRSCPPLRAPRNGALACDEWAYGQFCNQQCNDQFDVPPGRYEPFFICGSSGLWSTTSVLDCSFRKRANRFNLASEVQYFSGDCSDPETQRAIQEAFIELLSGQTIGADVCEGWQECRAENVNVVCGQSTRKRGDLGRRKKRSLMRNRRAERSFSMDNYVDYLLLREVEDTIAESAREPLVFEIYRRHDAKRAARRNARETIKKRRNKRSLGFFITISFEIVADVSQNATDQFEYEDNAFDTIYTLYDVLDSLEEKAMEGALVPDVTEIELELDDTGPEAVEYEDPKPTCLPGQAISYQTFTCVPCSPGSYYDDIEESCVLCPLGQYQDSEGQLECKQCPEDHTTLEEGALQEEQCFPVCKPGQFSINGVEPCALCEIGFYQPEANQDNCLKCPQFRQRTLERGSTSVFDCLFECAQGRFSSTGLEPCKDCAIRYYQPNFGQQTCELCPGINTTLSPGAVYETDCNVTATCDQNNCVNGGTCLPLIEGNQCQCLDGFEGEFCEVNIDDCTDLSCENGGTCIDGVNTVTCVCVEGFEGDDCALDILECDSDVCSDHTTLCTDVPGGFVCECDEGYTGELCEEEILPCESGPCQNNGTCDSILADFTCTCPAGFTGDFCEVNIDDCHVDPCLNGGTCVDLIDAYECVCTPGFNGSTCENDLDLCDPDPCVNGICLTTKDNFTCVCPGDKAGRYCERDATLCDKGICVNGVCSIPSNISATGPEFVCDCTGTGYSGPRCESYIDHCSTGPCSNGGTCKNNIDDYSCICPLNFTGANCEQFINPCDELPCENNATCTPDAGSFRCLCPIGFEGERCENQWVICKEGFCQNGGTCGDPNSIEFCICPAGYKGVACEKNIDECKSQPCQNGGNCTDGINEYSCSCADGFSGTDCEMNIDECAPDPCVNGLCVDAINNYTCQCYDGYEGVDCETNTDDCISSECVNGACIDGNSTYRCECLPGYRGRLCEEDINECESNPCVNNASCTHGVNSFECTCEEGWTGIQCELSINDCVEGACHNGGTCIDRHLGYECQCRPGYKGDRCNRDINECASNPCVNGTCIDKVNGYVCECPRGREGKQCQVRTSVCQPNPCLNGGNCSLEEDGESFNCSCQEGFHGVLCKENLDDCMEHQCQNGARCIDEASRYSCACLPGFGGDLCGDTIDLCEVFPCENGGTCNIVESQVECTCPEGYEGALCQKNVDDCAPNPCINDGTCEDGLNSYTCVCPPGYSGEICEEDVDECLLDECDARGTHECQDGVASYTCICRHGFSGGRCDIAGRKCLVGAKTLNRARTGGLLPTNHLRPASNKNSATYDHVGKWTSVVLVIQSDEALRCSVKLSLVAKSNFDMLFTANQTGQYVALRDFSNQTVESFTLAFWIRTLSHDSLIFSHVTDDLSLTRAHLVLAVPAALTVIVDGVPIFTGLDINDDVWHHVALTYDSDTQLFLIYIDGENRKQQLMSLSDDVIHPSDVFVLGRLNTTTQRADLTPLYGSLSRLNIWDEVFDAAQIRNLSRACYVPVPGNVIGMVDFLEGDVGDVIFLDPSTCDAGDQCMDFPCGSDGYCVDSYFDFACICRQGLQGKTCEENPDDCIAQNCENGGTCVDGLGTFTCICDEGYTGTLCELEIVHGGWSEWTPWSPCSAECDGGDQSRNRSCNNPLPANGGSPCGSVTEEFRKCNEDPCPACREFNPPKNGDADCTTAPSGNITCSVFCDPGYDFSRSPLYEYTCGPESLYRWNHESSSNPKLRVPACTKYGKPTRFKLEIYSRFKRLYCSAFTPSQAASIKDSIAVAISANTLGLGCIATGRCNIEDVSLPGCLEKAGTKPRRGRRSTESLLVKTTIYRDVNITEENVTSSEEVMELPSAAEAIDELLDLSHQISSATEEGAFGIAAEGQVQNPTYELDFGSAECKPGLRPKYNETVCVPCEAGSFLNGTFCQACDFGYYQPAEGKTSCKKCPMVVPDTVLGAIEAIECPNSTHSIIT